MIARIAAGRRSDIGLVNWTLLHIGGRLAGSGPPNLFSTMARNRSLFRAWLLFASNLMPFGGLPRRETELVILRTAALNNCEYEKIHHRRLAQRAGISAEETQRVIDLDLDGWSPRERAQLAATDQLHRDRNLDERTWHELRQHLDEPAAIEFLLLAGHYTMLATFINTLGIALDHDVRELQQA
ncbi:MAG: hypothetical protein QOK12_1387 [Mycobacterium sp.]|nr:hypothetical protein [Mycobacterium sp.]